MKFMNMWKYGARNGYFDKEGGGDQPKGGAGGSGGADDDPEKDNGAKPPAGGVYLTDEQFQALLKGNKSDDDNKNDKSVFDRLNDDRNRREERERDNETFKKAVIFNTGVDSFIEENKDLFSSDVSRAVKLISDDEKDEIQREKLLKAVIAKDFFRKEDMQNLLPADQRAFVTDNIGVPEKYLTDKAEKLHELMNMAVYYAREKIKRDHAANGGTGDPSKTPKASGYVQGLRRKTKASA